MNTLNDLLLYFVQDAVVTEQEMLKSLPTPVARLKGAAIKHVLEFQVAASSIQLSMLKNVFATMGQSSEGEACEAILSLLKECEELLRAEQPSAFHQAGLFACIQAIHCYSLTRCGALLGWAEDSDDRKAIGILGQLVDHIRSNSSQTRESAVRRVRQAH